MSLLSCLAVLPALAPVGLAPVGVLRQDAAAGAPAAAPAAAEPTPLFSMWIDDMPGLMPSPKDAGLVVALSMLDERLVDLMGELEGEMPPLPPSAIPVATELIMGRKSLRVLPATDPNAPLPVMVQFEVQSNSADEARGFAGRVLELMGDMGMPLSDVQADGSRLIETPDGPPMRLGLNGPTFALSMGGSVPAPGRPTLGALPQGVRPTMSMFVDIGALSEMGLSFIEMQAPPEEAEQVAAIFDAYGLSSMAMHVDMGVDAERGYSRVLMPGYGATLRRMGILAEGGLDERDFAMIPADAQWAQLSTFDANGTLDYVLEIMAPMMAAEGIEDPLGTIREETGFDLRADLVAHLGTTMAMYTSRTTGGGGMLSTVATMELVNPAGMLETLNRLRGLIDGMAASEARGYVRIRGWKREGVDLMTLTFPGLPVPLGMTLAVTESHLVAGLTPQATLGAIEHMRGGGPGLLANERFRAQLPADPLGAMQVQFIDIPELAEDSYGIASLVTAMIANAMRSPASDREPGLIMPSYPRLLGDAKAMVTVARLAGDDLVELGRSDNSMLVNMTGMIGWFTSSPLMVAVGTGFMSGIASSRVAQSAPGFIAPVPASEWDDEAWYEGDELTEEEREMLRELGYLEAEPVEEVVEEAVEEVVEEPVEEPVKEDGR